MGCPQLVSQWVSECFLQSSLERESVCVCVGGWAGGGGGEAEVLEGGAGMTSSVCLDQLISSDKNKHHLLSYDCGLDFFKCNDSIFQIPT